MDELERMVRDHEHIVPVGRFEDAQQENYYVGMPVFADAQVPHPLFKGRWNHVQGIVVGLKTYLVEGTTFTRVRREVYSGAFRNAAKLRQVHVQLSPSGVQAVHRADKIFELRRV